MEAEGQKQSVASRYAQAEGVPAHEHRDIFIDLATRLEPLRDQAIIAKGPVEDRMIRSLQQYNGWSDATLAETKNKPLDGARDTDEPPVIHLTRQITDQITAKVINMLLPSNERGWEIEPTPVPELMFALKDERPLMQQPVLDPMGNEMPAEPVTDEAGQPMTVKDQAQLIKDEADKRAKGMQREMDDQLTEAKFPKLGRRVIKSGFKVGSGFVHGPVMTGKTRIKREKVEGQDEYGNTFSEWTKTVIEDTAADYQFVDPFAFYPEPVESLELAEWAWLWESMSPTRIERLKAWPGFIAEQIDVLLKLDPDHGALKGNLKKRADAEGNTPVSDKNYSMWRYFGPVPNATLEMLGELDESDVGDDDDLSHTTMAEVWMSQGIVIKVKITPMEEATRLPFYGFCYEESETSIFGYGIPDHVRDSQVVIDASWHMILHNAAISSGPIILRLAGAIRPLDGDNNIDGGLKQFEVDSTEMPGGVDNFSMDNAFKLIQIDARTDALMQILEKAIELAQLETNYPALAQGQPTEAVTTTSGLAMLDNAQTAPQRTIAQRWDDDIVIPALEELYDWNMIYNPDDDIKGDYKIVAHGATRLVNKDMQAQHLQVISALFDNPRYAGMGKDYGIMRAILKTAELDAEQLMISEDDFKALQEAPPSPAEEAELALLQAKARREAAEAMKIENEIMNPEQGMSIDQEIRMEELALKERGQVRDLQRAEMELRSAELRAVSAGELEMYQLQATQEARDKDRDLQASLKLREISSKEMLDGINARIALQREQNRQKNMNMGFDSEH